MKKPITLPPIDLYMEDREAVAAFARRAWTSSEGGRDFASLIRAFVDEIAKGATPEDDIRFIECLKDRLLQIEMNGSLRVGAVVRSAILELIAEVNGRRWPKIKFPYSEVA